MLTLEEVLLGFGDRPDWLALLVLADSWEDNGEWLQAEGLRWLVANERWPQFLPHGEWYWYCVGCEGRPVDDNSTGHWLPTPMRGFGQFREDLPTALRWFLDCYSRVREAVQELWETGRFEEDRDTPRCAWRSPSDLSHVEGYLPICSGVKS